MYYAFYCTYHFIFIVTPVDRCCVPIFTEEDADIARVKWLTELAWRQSTIIWTCLPLPNLLEVCSFMLPSQNHRFKIQRLDRRDRGQRWGKVQHGGVLEAYSEGIALAWCHNWRPPLHMIIMWFRDNLAWEPEGQNCWPWGADNGRNSLLISVFAPEELSKDASFSAVWLDLLYGLVHTGNWY